MTTPDNTPAFPSQLDYGDGQITSWTGMTLRDYFAAKALSGLIVNGDNINLPVLTAFCYETADAMLKAREV